MECTNKELIAVVGATGLQGGDKNRRPATDQVLGVGSNKFPGLKERPVSSTLIENARKSILAGADEPSLRGRS